MYKHLFLEGDSGSGKSTIIRKIIAPYIDRIGGFTSQRLQNEKDETIAFRIVPAHDLRLAVPYEDTHENIFRIIAGEKKGYNNLEVFETEGSKLLADTKGKELILLDEIGGVELKNEVFRKKLFEILSGDVPCIGVIKQEHKASYMSGKSGNKKELSEHNSRLRQLMLNECNCKILQFKRNDPAVESEIKLFIDDIFN